MEHYSYKQRKDNYYNSDWKKTLYLRMHTYAYYPLTEEPANYKEVSADENGKLVFGEVKGKEAEALTGVKAELLTKSSYGDYQVEP